MIEIFKENSLSYLFIIFITILVTLIVILTKNIHGSISLDTSVGPQKIHDKAIPRIGGVVIFLTLLILSVLLTNSEIFVIIMLSSIPTFISGLYDDICKNISHITRLLSAFLSGTIFVILSGSWISSVGISWVDYILYFELIAIPLTILSIATSINAFNIIDGLNGLSIGTVLLIIITTFIINFENLDHSISEISLNVFLVLIAILIFNFPKAKIFIGDCGAYLLGFIVSSVIILMPEKNEDINSFSSLLLILYPFYELMKTIFRRLKSENAKTWMPDNKHLHSLLYQYNIKYKKLSKVTANPISTLQILILPFFCCIWTILFSDNQLYLIFGVMIFVLIYEILYRFLENKLRL